MFAYACQRTGLDPFSKQIYAIKRGGKMTIQAGIDGLRSIAERTGQLDGSETFWCGEDGEWKDVWLGSKPPAAAKTIIHRKGSQHPFVGVARYADYNAGQGLWNKMGAAMIAKCYTPDTEILTDHGFVRFPDVTKDMRILQVTDSGLEPVDATPFAQSYSGPMIKWASKRGGGIDFCVTPNHDMLLCSGEVIEASDLFDRTTQRSQDRIPLTASFAKEDAPYSNTAIKLAAAYLADGSDYNNAGFKISVSRDRKIEKLKSIGGFYRSSIRECAGDTARSSSGRVITTKSNKIEYFYEWSAIEEIVGPSKKISAETVLSLSQRQARLLVDTWMFFDGHEQRNGVRRVSMARETHASIFEIAAVQAGYSISERRQTTSDIGSCWNFTLTSKEDVRVRLRWDGPSKSSVGLEIQDSNPSGAVWCVTVPTHVIVTRRHGMSWIGRQCSEALALRKAFPADLSGVYGSEEMEQAEDVQAVTVTAEPAPAAPAGDEKVFNAGKAAIAKVMSVNQLKALQERMEARSGELSDEQMTQLLELLMAKEKELSEVEEDPFADD